MWLWTNDLCETDFEFHQNQQLLIDPKLLLPMHSPNLSVLNPAPYPVLHPVLSSLFSCSDAELFSSFQRWKVAAIRIGEMLIQQVPFKNNDV